MGKILILFALCFPSLVHAQLRTPEEALDRYVQYPHERVYLKLDKGDYLAGETMFFKAYVFQGFRLSNMATNLYFECLDGKKNVVYANLLPVGGGISNGSFTIPKNLPEDVYFIRAYTHAMLAEAPQFQFVQPVNIFNPASFTSLVPKKVAWDATVFPEGGNLLADFSTQVAVRLWAKGQLPAAWSGYVFDKADTSYRLATFQKQEAEVATFFFLPQTGKHYAVKITDVQGNQKTIDLPPVRNTGINMQAAPMKDRIGYRLMAKGQPLTGFKLIAQQQGELLFSGEVRSNKEEVSGTILLDSTIAGMVHLTLFDPAGVAVSERLVFVNAELLKPVTPQVQLSTYNTQKRGLNKWQLEVDSALAVTMAVEVINGSTPAVEEQYHLLSALYLGDVAGKPYKASWYFKRNGEINKGELDAYLLTEKWQAFHWDSLRTKEKVPTTYQPEEYLSFEGTAKKGKNLLQNSEINLLVQLKDSSRTLVLVKTDSAGKFVLSNLLFQDTAKVYFQANNKKAWATGIDIDFKRLNRFTPFAGALPPTIYYSVQRKPTDTLPSHVREYLANMERKNAEDSLYKTLKAVVVRAKKVDPTKELESKLSSPLFRSINETVFDFVNQEQPGVMGSGNILEWLASRVAGLQIQNSGGVVVPIIRGSAVKLYRDEFQIEAAEVNMIPVSDIAMVKVMKDNFAMGGNVIAIYTLRGGIVSKVQSPSLPSNTLLGYAPGASFKPLQSTEEGRPDLSDTRSVLFWSIWQSGKQKENDLSFYNNDTAQTVRLIVNGFTNTGLPIYLDQDIPLKK